MNDSPTARNAILALLAEAGAKGMLAAPIEAKLPCVPSVVSWQLRRLCEQGLVGWWPDPIGRTYNRRRFWLAEHHPKVCPPPSGEVPNRDKHPAPRITVRADGVQVVAGYTHNHKYQCAPGERVPGLFASLGVGRYLESRA